MSAKRILFVVDDEAIILLSLKQQLRLRFGSDYLYETALSGEEALERLRALYSEGSEVAVLVSDWLMPGMKGDEFLVRVHREFPSIRLIMLTGHADESEMTRLRKEADLFLFVRKPWNSEKLMEAIERAAAT